MELFGLGAPELLLILFVLLLFFGKDRLPGLAKSIGNSFKELRKGFSDGNSNVDDGSKAKDGTTKDKK